LILPKAARDDQLDAGELLLRFPAPPTEWRISPSLSQLGDIVEKILSKRPTLNAERSMQNPPRPSSLVLVLEYSGRTRRKDEDEKPQKSDPRARQD